MNKVYMAGGWDGGRRKSGVSRELKEKEVEIKSISAMGISLSYLLQDPT